jgi:hypothetical protein
VELFAVNGTGSKGVGFLISWYTSSDSFITSTVVKYANVLNSWVVDSIVADAPSNAAYARLRIRCYADNVLGGMRTRPPSTVPILLLSELPLVLPL